MKYTTLKIAELRATQGGRSADIDPSRVAKILGKYLADRAKDALNDFTLPKLGG